MQRVMRIFIYNCCIENCLFVLAKFTCVFVCVFVCFVSFRVFFYYFMFLCGLGLKTFILLNAIIMLFAIHIHVFFYYAHFVLLRCVYGIQWRFCCIYILCTFFSCALYEVVVFVFVL